SGGAGIDQRGAVVGAEADAVVEDLLARRALHGLVPWFRIPGTPRRAFPTTANFVGNALRGVPDVSAAAGASIRRTTPASAPRPPAGPCRRWSGAGPRSPRV